MDIQLNQVKLTSCFAVQKFSGFKWLCSFLGKNHCMGHLCLVTVELYVLCWLDWMSCSSVPEGQFWAFSLHRTYRQKPYSMWQSRRRATNPQWVWYRDADYSAASFILSRALVSWALLWKFVHISVCWPIYQIFLLSMSCVKIVGLLVGIQRPTWPRICSWEATDSGEDTQANCWINTRKCYSSMRGVCTEKHVVNRRSTQFYFGVGVGWERPQRGGEAQGLLEELFQKKEHSKRRHGGVRWPGLVGNCEQFSTAAGGQWEDKAQRFLNVFSVSCSRHSHHWSSYC